MKKAILFVRENFSKGTTDYIKNIGLEYNIDFEVLRSLEEVNKSSVKYVITRGISREVICSMENKLWYNDLELTKLVADKQRTKECLIEKGLSKYVIKSYKDNITKEDLPVILKDNTGSKGSNIYLCNSIEEVDNIKAENKGVEFIAEEYIGENNGLAVDYRVYMINFVPKLFIKRTNKGLTSNVSKGGVVEVIKPLFEKELIEINKAIPLNVTAIDFTIDKNGDLKIFEMNASPGVKALYLNDIDAYRPFMEWYASYINN